MGFQDKSIQCSECGTNFVFSAAEQEFFTSKGYTNDPKRCPACRQSRRTQRYGDDSSGPRAPRQMFPAVCAECNKETEVPFQPRQGRPVYCNDCYSKVRPNRHTP